MEQNTIDWFISEFQKQIQFVSNSELDIWLKDLLPKAKDQYKKDICEAFFSGMKSNQFDPNMGIAKQYYTDTYGE